MFVLGLSYDFHDSSAALLRNGELVGVAAEERLSLQKHDSSYPALAIASLLEEAGIASGDLDEVVYYEEPAAKYARILTSGFARFPRGASQFVSSNKKWLQDKLWVKASLSSRFRINPKRVHTLSHHESHLAQAFLASPFDEAAILVLDGVGEWDCTTLAMADSRSSNGFRVIEEYEYPNSIGLVYAAFTAYLGFKPNSAEASTMALSAFGRCRYVDEMRGVFGLTSDGTYAVDPSFFDFEAHERSLYTEKLVKTFGPPRDFQKPYLFDALKDGAQVADEDDQRCADIAASLQQVLSETLLGLCKRLRASTGSDNLCLAGGVALNCLANSDLVKKSGFTNFFIPPDPGDGGACFGAAMHRAAMHGAVAPMTHPYHGCSFDGTKLLPLLSSDPAMSFLMNKERKGVQRASKISRTYPSDEQTLIDAVVTDLAQGRIVAWVQGRFEVGPRALGNRSLLIHPGRLDVVRRMSRTVKSHTSFRPYALSLTEDAAIQILDTDSLAQPVLKWMQTIWPVKQEYRDRLRGAIHTDGTTRPQICTDADNPRYWALLKRFGEFTGTEAILNTSLNERSFPMIGDPRMALAMFARTGIDTLVIDDVLLRKDY